MFIHFVVLFLSLASVSMTADARDNSGWWVILGSVPSPDNNFTPEVESSVDHIEAAARRCGLKSFHDFSSKFRNFTSGYTVVVVGPYSSKANAYQAADKAQGCVPGTYVKLGVYAGE